MSQPGNIMPIHSFFESGLYFTHLIEQKLNIYYAIKKSTLVYLHGLPDQFPYNNHPPIPEEFLNIREQEKLYDHLLIHNYIIFPNDTVNPDSLLLDNIAKYAFDELKKRGKSYLYYTLLGLLVLNHWKIDFCNCCNWRIVPFLHGRKNCPACEYKNGKSTNKNRIQREIFEKLKKSSEFLGFMKVREIGKYQLLLTALGYITNPKNFMFDEHDYTNDPEYRLAKTRLANLWRKHTPKDHSAEREENRKVLIDLARQGRSKAEVARQLGVQRSTVTKICQKDPAINALFLASKQKRPAV